MAIFKGAGVAIVTPMHEDGSVNYEKMGELVEMQIVDIPMRLLSAGRPENLPRFHMRNIWM